MSFTENKQNRRVLRVEKEVHQVIAEYFISGLRVKLPGLVTVSAVHMPADLQKAKVYVRVFLPEADQAHTTPEEVIELLNLRAFEIQSHIGRTLTLRYCPKIHFFLDEQTEKILKIDKLLQENSNSQTDKLEVE